MAQSLPTALTRIGSENAIIATLEGTYNLGSVAAGANAGVILSVTPEFGGLMLLNFTMELRVDTDDAAHQFPNGASLTAAQRGAPLVWVYGDSGFSGLAFFTDDGDGTRTTVVTVENFDSGAHTYFIKYKYYGLFFTGA